MGTKPFKALFGEGLDIEPTICARCGFCTFVCPAYLDELWDSQSPRGKLFQLKELIDKKKPIPSDFADRIFKCTLCGACEEICQTNIPLLRFWQQVRNEVSRLDLWPEAVKFLDKSIQSSDNIMQLDQADRTLWMDMVDDIAEDRIGANAQYGYFLGCNISFKGTLAHIGENTAKLFDHLGIEFTFLGEDELCCGNPYFVAGEFEKAKDLAQKNLDAFKKLGVKTIVFNCPGCHRAFNEEFGHLLGEEAVKDLEFLSFSQFTARMIREGKLKFTKEFPHKVTWHDPCELGRHQNIYDDSRFVLNSIPGLELIEMKQTKNRARCCGGGGLLKGTNPVMSVRVSSRRIEMAEKTGSSILSSECPSCSMSFADGLENRDTTIDFKDLSEIVIAALGLE